MLKEIKPTDKLFKSNEFQKDKYKFFLILQNLKSKTLELYSDGENYVLCRGGKKWPTWVWTKDNFNKELLQELKDALDLYRLDEESRFTCKKELYNLLKDHYEGLGDYYFEMGYLECNTPALPKKTDGHLDYATLNDKEVLSRFIYEESVEISDVKTLTLEEAEEEFYKRLEQGNYFVWKNQNEEVVAQAFYKVLEGNAKVSGVYTAKNERNKGYAANLIYNLTKNALDDGNHVSLYTDYNYAPSNRSYKNVGYEDVDVLINFSCRRRTKRKE